MQIKFNKIVKPMPPKTEELKPAAQPMQQARTASQAQDFAAQALAAAAPQQPKSQQEQTAQLIQKERMASQMQDLAEQALAAATPQPSQPAVQKKTEVLEKAEAQAQATVQEVQKVSEAQAEHTPKAESKPQTVQTAGTVSAVGTGIEETLKEYIGQPIRVYMVDKENVTGRLEWVEGGRIKLSNARSAGSDYYFDEDIINTVNIVRIRFARVITKEDYCDFMNI